MIVCLYSHSGGFPVREFTVMFRSVKEIGEFVSIANRQSFSVQLLYGSTVLDVLSLSNIGSPLYVWVFSDYAISEASEEMSANYAEILSTLTSPWFMVLAIAATVVISIIVGVIAKKVYNKQFANAGIM